MVSAVHGRMIANAPIEYPERRPRMKRRPFVQRTSVRKQVLRRRRIHTSFADTWERLRNDARRLREEGANPEVEAQTRAA
jgi:hypothetical protein